MKMGKSVHVYYYDKMLLLNACEIQGKKEVDCFIYDINDGMVRASSSLIQLDFLNIHVKSPMLKHLDNALPRIKFAINVKNQGNA